MVAVDFHIDFRTLRPKTLWPNKVLADFLAIFLHYSEPLIPPVHKKALVFRVEQYDVASFSTERPLVRGINPVVLDVNHSVHQFSQKIIDLELTCPSDSYR